MWKGAWRRGSHPSSANRKNDNDINVSTGSSTKSNNTNSKVEGEDFKVVLNLQNVIAVEGKAAKEGTESTSTSNIQTKITGNPNTLPATDNNDSGQNDAEHATIPRLQPTAKATASSRVEPEELSISATHTVVFNPTRSGRMSSTESMGRSLFSESDFPVPKLITTKNMKKHLPKNTEDYIQAYMSSSDLFNGDHNIIPLWKPSPSNESDSRAWRHHVYIGDVGIFNADGGFDTLFNIFNSTTANRERGYEPPNDFVPYPKSLEELSIASQQAKLPGVGGIKLVGFEAVSKSTQSRFSRAKNSYQANGSECSAICLRAGYLQVSIRQWEIPRILEYVRDHQESWQHHVEETSGKHFHARPLLVITATWRTENWALATGSRQWPQKCQGTITLKEFFEGSHIFYEWEVTDDKLNHIFAHFGPSPQLRENQDSYFSAMDEGLNPKWNPDIRKGTKECHCVAIGAYSLRKKGWIRGGSVRSGRSSKTTIRPVWARMSLPTQLDSSIQEEEEY